jgi:hypothetical protein
MLWTADIEATGCGWLGAVSSPISKEQCRISGLNATLPAAAAAANQQSTMMHALQHLTVFTCYDQETSYSLYSFTQGCSQTSADKDPPVAHL